MRTESRSLVLVIAHNDSQGTLKHNLTNKPADKAKGCGRHPVRLFQWNQCLIFLLVHLLRHHHPSIACVNNSLLSLLASLFLHHFMRLKHSPLLFEGLKVCINYAFKAAGAIGSRSIGECAFNWHSPGDIELVSRLLLAAAAAAAAADSVKFICESKGKRFGLTDDSNTRLVDADDTAGNETTCSHINEHMKNDVETVDTANALPTSFARAVNHQVKHWSSPELEFSKNFRSKQWPFYRELDAQLLFRGEVLQRYIDTR